MQQITVRSTKVLKTGTNKRGEWELIGIKDEDGNDYTTFNKAAKHLSVGTVIEFELDEKEGNKTFDDYTVVSETEKPTPTSQSSMTPEKWAEKDRIERQSIESQVAVKTVAELVIAGKLSETSSEYKSMLVWCRIRIKPLEQMLQPSPASPKSLPEGIEHPNGSQIPSGELITPEQLRHLKELATKANMTLGSVVSACIKDRGWKVKKLEDLTREQYAQLEASFKKGEE